MSSSNEKRPPLPFSLAQKLHLIPAFISIAASTIFGLAASIFHGKDRCRTLGRQFMATAARSFTGNLNASELQFLDPTCDQAYHQFCKSSGLKPEIETTDSGVYGFWLGSKSASFVIIHFHGGSFVQDIRPEHFQFWHRVVQEKSRSGIDMAVFFPVYSLTPNAAYPTQFREAVEALRHVIGGLGRSPGDIMLSGDSAGANLCLAIVSHITHPSNDIPALEIESPLRGMLLISPWLTFQSDWPSMKYNLRKDIDSPKIAKKWAQMYLKDRDSDNYTEPVLAPAEWWENCPVTKTLLIGGSDEILLDSFTPWAEKFKQAKNDLSLVICKGEFHIEPIIAPIFGDRQEKESEREIKAWVE